MEYSLRLCTCGKVTPLSIYIFWFFLAIFTYLIHNRNVILGAFLTADC